MVAPVADLTMDWQILTATWVTTRSIFSIPTASPWATYMGYGQIQNHNPNRKRIWEC